MWQRVQTLYLAIATALIASMFFCNKAGDITYTAYIPYLIHLVIITLLDFIALTVYTHRIFQMRTAVLAAIITTALQAWLAVDFFATGNEPLFHVSAVFPAIAVIFDLLAARNIFSDELMVRSSNRLRSAKKNRK